MPILNIILSYVQLVNFVHSAKSIFMIRSFQNLLAIIFMVAPTSSVAAVVVVVVGGVVVVQNKDVTGGWPGLGEMGKKILNQSYNKPRPLPSLRKKFFCKYLVL